MPYIIAVAGAGGKTTYIKKLRDKYILEGKRVLITTTTHMMLESDTDLSDDAGIILKRIMENGFCHAGTMADLEKIKSLSENTYNTLCQNEEIDIILVEADGSRHLPVKIPGKNEPVIPENVCEIVIIQGEFSLGLKAADNIHRYDLIRRQKGFAECFEELDESANGLKDNINLFDEGLSISRGLIDRITKEFYVKPLGEKYKNARIRVLYSNYKSGRLEFYEQKNSSGS